MTLDMFLESALPYYLYELIFFTFIRKIFSDLHILVSEHTDLAGTQDLHQGDDAVHLSPTVMAVLTVSK